MSHNLFKLSRLAGDVILVSTQLANAALTAEGPALLFQRHPLPIPYHNMIQNLQA